MNSIKLFNILQDGIMNAIKKYDENYHPAKIENFATAGYTVRQICKKLNISPDTFYRWKKVNTDVSDAFERGRKILADSLVPYLRKRAKGFSCSEVTWELQNKKNQQPELVIVKKVKKYFPPDVAALKFFLNNRLPEDWQDRSTIEHEVSEDSGIIILTGKKTVEDWQKEQESKKRGK